MIKENKICFVLSFIFIISFTQALYTRNVYAEETTPVKNIVRIQGTDRFKTSKAIAEEVNSNTMLENVVIASGYDFPDGLSGGTLAKKLNAPLLMAGNMPDSSDAMNYISEHLKQNGNVYILGGTGVVSQDTQNYLTQKGYMVVRICGKDRFETNNSIINNLKVQEGTPVFISNAYGFADALSASGISAIKGYPILLTKNNELPDFIKKQLSSIKPSKIYIVGGTGMISSDEENQIKSLMPSSEIIRLSGSDRYETSINLYKYFDLDTKSIILASGRSFPDALSGSLLSAKFNASMVLCDENNLEPQQNEFNEKSIENYYLLGGTGALSTNVELSINFDKEAEMENIKNVYSKIAQCIRLKDTDEYLTLIDASSPAYDISKEIYESLFKYCSENNIDIITTFDSFDFISINYKEAVVKVKETDAITDNNSKTTQYETDYTISTLKKTNGSWKFYNTEISQ